MQALLNWTLEVIREDHSDFSWMEELRFDWTPLVKSALEKMVAGQTVLIVTDDKRKWFSKYIRNAVNCPDKGRPFLPIYDLQSCFPSLQSVRDNQDMDLLEDMLDISFPNGYFIWYIGDSKYTYTKISFRNDENFLWVMNDQVPNSFPFRDSDPLLDIKLIQLYKLFDKTVEAVLCGEVDIDE
jgi:hypothetical protein